MSLELIASTIVVQADQHNPSILHDSMLRLNGIIDPNDSSYAVAQQLSTPAFSTVEYKNGISFLVDNPRLQIRNTKIKSDFNGIIIDKLATKYIQKLPLVNYKGVGINMQAMVVHSNSKEYILENFIKQDKFNLEVKGGNFKFIFDVDDYKLTLTIASGKYKVESGEKEGIVVDANYHKDISPKANITEDIISVIDKYSERKEHFLNTVKTIFSDTLLN